MSTQNPATAADDAAWVRSAGFTDLTLRLAVVDHSGIERHAAEARLIKDELRRRRARS